MITDADARSAVVLAPGGGVVEDEPTRFAAQTLIIDGAARPRARRRLPRALNRYQLLLVAVDAFAAIAGGSAAFLLRFGRAAGAQASSLDVTQLGSHLDAAFGFVLPFAWLCATAANRAYERRFVGVGAAEFQRVSRAFLQLAVVTAFLFYALNAPISRGFALPAMGFTVVCSLGGRYAARRWLHHRRRSGTSLAKVIAVGGASSVVEFTRMLRKDLHAGMKVVGACLPVGAAEDPVAVAELTEIGVPVVGDVDSITEAVRQHGARAVAVLSGDITPQQLRWISWRLGDTEADLVVAPGLMEVAGRRLHIQPVAGLPLLHVEIPTLTGFRRMVKNGFDRFVAATALLLLAPALLVIATMVRCSSRGPALFFQTRVGRNGKTFRMVKFRSMHTDAEQRLAELQAHNEAGDGLLFKIREDPRVTSVGRVLRRFSLDELPQLLNVLSGAMSLVGPRPPLPAEVEKYDGDVHRRLLVKPGLTGLWQVSGRSDLSWEEAVRLDLRYVDDWSLSLDMLVMWKTVRAVLFAKGAY
ncbi:sugar transferase [uncultured Jatrophihabitans sp.]|uniref:sugar transferase n=1 Tax=uncultured Jatrophihabitans sp. TaxID=1610747 RepID=UPI0035CA729D